MIVSESLVFTVDPVTSFLTTFGDSSRPDEALRQTAKQVRKAKKSKYM